MAVVFDGEKLEVIFTSIGTYDAQVDLYSAWKEWAKTGDNMKYPKAFDTTGGDPTTATESIPPYTFLRNDLGWRLRAPEEDGEVFIEGDLFGRDPLLGIMLPSVGDFTVFVQLQVSSKGTVIETGTSGLTAQEAADLAATKAAAEAAQVEMDFQRKIQLGEKISFPNDPAKYGALAGKIAVYVPGTGGYPSGTLLLLGDGHEDAEKTIPYRGDGMDAQGDMVVQP